MVVGHASAQGWFRPKSVSDRFNKAVEYYNEGRYGAAESALNKILVKDPNEYEEAVRFMLIKTKYQSGDTETARILAVNYLNNPGYVAYERFVIEALADIFVQEGNYSAALRQYLRTRNNEEDQIFLSRITKKISNLFGLYISSDLVAELLVTERDTVNQIILRLVNTFKEINAGNTDQAAQELSFISPEYVPDELFGVYEQLILASYQERSTIISIGIVAPLTGIDSEIGLTFLKGIQRAFQHHLQVGHKVSYIVMDNVSDEIETARSISSLLKNPNVTAIIAPPGSRDALIAASVITGSTIPIIIPTSTQDGLTELSNNIFQFNSNLSLRGEFAARYSFQNLGASSIAVIAPADSYGKILVDAFLKELDLHGVEPVAVEWYADDSQDLKSEFKAIRRKAWTLVPEEKSDEEYLGMEFDSLDALFDISTEDFFDLPEESTKKKLSRSDSAEVVLETIQAIYVPAHEKHVSYLGTQFPVYNLKTTLIGTEGWYNLDILNQETIGPHVDGMVVISSEYPNDRIEESLPENIVNPSIFYEGYDTAQMLLHIAAKTKNDPSSFAATLSRVDGIHGNFHSYAFDESYKHVNTAMHVVKYENSRFQDLGFFKGDSLVMTYFPAP